MIENYNSDDFVDFTKKFLKTAQRCRYESRNDPFFRRTLIRFLCVIGYYLDGESKEKIENGFDAIVPTRKAYHVEKLNASLPLNQIVAKLVYEATVYGHDISDENKITLDDLSAFDYRILDYLNREPIMPYASIIKKHYEHFFELAPQITSRKVVKLLYYDLAVF